MMNLRLASVLTALALAAALTASIVSAGAPPATTTPAKTGSVSGTVVDKDGKPAAAAMIRYTPFVATTGPATAPAAGGRGGRGGARGAGNATTDDKGAFTIKDVPVGQVNITATLTAADGTRQRGTTTQPVEVKEGAESKVDAPIKLADAPMGRGGAAPTPPASMPGR